MSIFLSISTFISTIIPIYNYTFDIDTASTDGQIENLVSNINVWDMGNDFINPTVTGEYNIFDFVEYVQLMIASGGSPARDLFENPYDRSVTDDYKFDKLIENCRGILSLGAKPHLKLGNVPQKLSADVPENYGGFTVNVYPPEDYNIYYNYIYALASALVDEFGLVEVQSWHFGVLTEYENGDWFQSLDGTPESTATEYCKLYDYTVQALIDVLGEDVYVGAHSMTVTEGLWDEEIFIEHVAQGVNYANGGKGTHISYLSTSFYDVHLGEFTSGKTLSECFSYLRETAEKYGLTDLKFGVDEGRILSGTEGSGNSAILSRTTGYTWQAAYDARLYGQAIDENASYISSWSYLTESYFDGIPSISYHVATQITKFAGCDKLTVDNSRKGIASGEIKTYAALDSDGTIRIMAYNFKNTLKYYTAVNTTLNIKTDKPDGKATVTVYTIDDDCNYFDEWCIDREKYGITDDMFSWSPEDGCYVSNILSDENAKKLWNETLLPEYSEYCKLIPTSYETEIKDGEISISAKIQPNTVVFFEIA